MLLQKILKTYKLFNHSSNNIADQIFNATKTFFSQTYIGKILKFFSNEQKWSVKLEYNVVWLPAVPPYFLVSYICSSGHVLFNKTRPHYESHNRRKVLTEV